MVNYFLILCLSMMYSSISAVGDENPPYMTIIDIIGQFITDEQCTQKVKESIKLEFSKLVQLQKDKAQRIQQMLSRYENSNTANLFVDWQKFEEQKTQIVT